MWPREDQGRWTLDPVPFTPRTLVGSVRKEKLHLLDRAGSGVSLRALGGRAVERTHPGTNTRRGSRSAEERNPDALRPPSGLRPWRPHSRSRYVSISGSSEIWTYAARKQTHQMPK